MILPVICIGDCSIADCLEETDSKVSSLTVVNNSLNHRVARKVNNALLCRDRHIGHAVISDNHIHSRCVFASFVNNRVNRRAGNRQIICTNRLNTLSEGQRVGDMDDLPD